MFYIDIETVSAKESFDLLDDRWKALWRIYHDSREFEEPVEESYRIKAAFSAEFGKVACVGVGMVVPNTTGIGSAKIFRATAFASQSEPQVLQWLLGILARAKANVPLCGHNSTSFDFPFVCRRMVANRIALPVQLSCAMMGDKKPWEIPWKDTMKMWACGDFKGNARLDLIAATLGLQSPKSEMDGSKVHEAYYKAKNYAGIQRYCLGDVITTAKIYHLLTGSEFPGEVMEVDPDPPS